MNRRARVDRAPTGEGADAERDGGGVTADHGDPVQRDAEGVRRHLGEGGLVPLTLRADAKVHEHGLNSLTTSERRILQQASSRLRDRDKTS